MSKNNKEGLALARKRIQECIATQDPFLDLGNCGLVDLEELPELFECTHIEQLNFSGSWYDHEKNKWIDSINNLSNNQLKSVSNDIQKCIQLIWLHLGSSKISDISLLSGLKKLVYLDLSYNQISDLSFESGFSSLETLNLSYNQISDISFESNFSSLKTINLSNNEIRNINFESNFSSLETLDLSNNQITDISFESNFSSLRVLYLDFNKITDIRFLSVLTSLKTINLSNNEIRNINFESNFSSLEILNLSNNQITDIGFESNFSLLRILYLDFNKITDIRFLSVLTSLKTINLSNNEIRNINFESNFSSLEILNLSNNQITDIGFESNFSSLEILDLRYNQITDISFQVNFSSLRVLYLSNNQIRNINFESNFSSLEILDLKYNQITDISFQVNFSSLRVLYLSNNQITDISFESNFSSLQTLNLSNNQITDISFESNFSSLKTLDFSHNQISNVDILSRLMSLKSLSLNNNRVSNINILSKLILLQALNLSNNQITDISFESGFSSLQTLNLSNNQIKFIPKEILQLPIEITLEEYGGKLNLYNNPFEEPPIEIVKQGKQSMLDWYAAEKKKLNEIKIILIGEPKAGKTSLLRKLKDDDFKENEVQTDGVNIEDIDFGTSKSFNKQQKLHHLTGHFWDFGGQEIMSATHSFFLTNRSVYVLVLDARKDKDVSGTIRREVKRIKTTGGDSSIIVVANQIDINAGFGFENEYELQQEFPQVKYFLKTSCKTGAEIEVLKEKLEELILDAELLNTEIDEKWISIKEQFQEELSEENFLNADRFIEICNEFKLIKESSQQNALEFLHDLGLVLHFKEIKGYDYYVLNPYWITYGVYQILTSKKAGELQGEIPFSELEYIINKEEDKEKKYESNNFKRIIYTPNQRKFLVQVLNQFKLCFILPDQQSFILPDLLKTNEPFKITEPIRNDKSCIQFVYSYDFLPRSIMPIVLVETEQFHKAIWRTGCVLSYNESKAFISQYDNRLSIVVTGEHKKKREFLAIIRNFINKINKKLTDQPSKLIPLPGIEDGYVDYEELLDREKDGEKEYKIYRPIKKTFDIGKLLEGIPDLDKIDKVLKKAQILEEKLDSVIDITEDIKKGIDKLSQKLDKHYQYLIQLPTNKDLKNILESSIQELNETQTKDIVKDMMLYLGSAFELQQEEQEDSIKEIYKELTKTDNLGVKLKVATPLIGVVGVGIEGEFDLKNWSQSMYKKHQWSIFQFLEKLY